MRSGIKISVKMFLKFVYICILFGIAAGEIVRLKKSRVADEILRSNKRILDVYVVGGNEAKPHSHPYQAALITRNQQNLIFMCSGSLISPNFVLTTTSCVNKINDIYVFLGLNDLQEYEEENFYTTDFYIRHYAWNKKTNAHNIAVVKLTKSANISSLIQTVKLPISTGNEPLNAVLSGWGKTSDSANQISFKLQEVELPVMTNEMCEQIIGGITPEHMCTSGKNKKGACHYDIGAPLISNGTQYGIVSAINPICESNLPTVYTRVSKYLNWICANTDVEVQVRK